jgi:hypothetical protein
MVRILRQNGKRDFNKWLVDRVTVGLRTAQPNTDAVIGLPYRVATDAQWLRQNGKRDFNKWLVDRVTYELLSRILNFWWIHRVRLALGDSRVCSNSTVEIHNSYLYNYKPWIKNRLVPRRNRAGETIRRVSKM